MTVRILHYGDVETALDEPQRLGRLAGGLRSLDGEDALVLGSGDNTAPSALSLATDGRACLAFFRAASPVCDTFGNHDFDFGAAVAQEIAAEAPQPWLCANAETDDGRFAADVSDPSTVVDVDGTTVGIVGVAHPKTATMNPTAEGIRFTDPVPAVRTEARRLRDGGAEYVVVASHCGHGDEEIARGTSVDAVFGGHVHDVYADVIEGTAVVRTGRAARHFSEVTLGGSGGRPTITLHDVDDQESATDVVRTFEDAMATHGLDEVVATAPTPIERSEEASTVAESRIGNLVTDALRWRADADVALSPPGGLRSGEPLSGDVTVGELVALLPYEDDLAVVELSGRRLRESFVAVPFGYHEDGYPSRYCSHVSGARVVWDDETGELLDATVGGDPIDDDEQYSVAVADYMVETDHVNDAFDEDDVVARYGLAREAVVDYARDVGLEPELEGRIDRPTLPENE